MGALVVRARVAAPRATQAGSSCGRPDAAAARCASRRGYHQAVLGRDAMLSCRSSVRRPLGRGLHRRARLVRVAARGRSRDRDELRMLVGWEDDERAHACMPSPGLEQRRV